VLWIISVYTLIHFNGLSEFVLSNTDYPLQKYKMVGCYNLNSSRWYDKKVYSLKDTYDSHRCFYICNERGYMYAAINEYIPYFLFNTHIYAIYYLQLVTYVTKITIGIIASAAMKHRVQTIRKIKKTVKIVLVTYRNIVVVPVPSVSTKTIGLVSWKYSCSICIVQGWTQLERKFNLGFQLLVINQSV